MRPGTSASIVRLVAGVDARQFDEAPDQPGRRRSACTVAISEAGHDQHASPSVLTREQAKSPVQRPRRRRLCDHVHVLDARLMQDRTEPEQGSRARGREREREHMAVDMPRSSTRGRTLLSKPAPPRLRRSNRSPARRAPAPRRRASRPGTHACVGERGPTPQPASARTRCSVSACRARRIRLAPRAPRMDMPSRIGAWCSPRQHLEIGDDWQRAIEPAPRPRAAISIRSAGHAGATRPIVHAVDL